MKIRRFFGNDMREALNQVKAELGADAVIMSNRKVANGVELVAAYDKEPAPKLQPTVTQQQKSGATKGKATPTLSEIIGDDGPDSLRELLQKQAEQKAKQAAVNQPTTTAATVNRDDLFNNDFSDIAGISDVDIAPLHNDDMSYLQPQSSSVRNSSAPNTDELSAIKEELASLRDVLQFQVADLMEAKQRRQQPIQRYLQRNLEGMGLSRALAQQLVSFTPDNHDERKAWVYLLNLLANRLKVNNNDILTQSGIVALVGPTGTGKTTTVAKLAARYAQKYGAESVALITIDSYRIAAFEQLATYGKIIGCVTKKAQSSEELAETLFSLRHKRLILIDTAGFSQRDERLIKQLGQFDNNQLQPVKKYLVAQANTPYQGLQRIVDAYKSTNLEGCIFTKLDECYSLGESISVAVENQLPVSYVTDGQKVPEDLKIAEPKSLVSVAAKLYKKYGLDHTNTDNQFNSAQAV